MRHSKPKRKENTEGQWRAFIVDNRQGLCSFEILKLVQDVDAGEDISATSYENGKHDVDELFIVIAAGPERRFLSLKEIEKYVGILKERRIEEACG